MALHDSGDPKTQADFERAMTAANVYRNRGDYTQAAKAVQEALRLRPSDLDARELAADLVYARGESQKAAEHYKNILEIDPKRASVEEKYAKAILDVAEGKRQQELLKDMLDHPVSVGPQRRSSGVAAMLSIAPGFGHVYCAQYVKGVIVFAAWALSWVLCLSLVGPPGDRLSTATVLFGCLATSLHLYAVLDAAAAAERTRRDLHDLTEP